MRDNQKQPAPAEIAQSEVQANTERLRLVSRDLFSHRGRFHAWQQALEGLIKDQGPVKAESHDPRNYHQTFHLKGMTEAGRDPIVGELQYGDDFHKGKGVPKLISYTCCQYGSGKSKQVETYTPDKEGLNYRIVYSEEVQADGSKVVKEQTGGDWTTTEYDAQGNKIEKAK